VPDALAKAMFRFIARRDHGLMLRVNNWHAPNWVRAWMIWATRGGDGWLWYAVTLAILFFGGEERWAAAAAAWTAAGAGCGVFLLLKRRTCRKRPCAIAEHCWAQLLPPDQFSFPSGHSITAFAIAVSLSLFYPSLLTILLFCAASIALSRIVLGMHFLSDVVAGCVIGAGLGYSAYLIYL
jgi:undecaprenyl-diphosphatase